MRLTNSVCILVVGFLLLAGGIEHLAQADTWPRFRGENGCGRAAAVNIPAEWTAEHELWRKDLAGAGHSSPVVWQRRIFVASADPETGLQFIQAFDAISGAELWQRELNGSSYAKHSSNSFATSTPAVDDRNLYHAWVVDGKLRLVALTHQGDLLWQQELDDFLGEHGFGASPVVSDGLVFFANDNDGQSHALATDATSGQLRWSEHRPSVVTSYSTPCFYEAKNGSGRQILLNSQAAGITALRTADGGIAWQRADLFNQRTISSPIVAGGMVIGTCGSGGGGKLLVAVRPDDSGSAAEVAFELNRGVPYIPTPLATDELLFLWHDRGTVACHELATGDLIWNKRVGGTYFSSPTLVGEKLYNISKDGQVIVLSASRDYELLGRKALGEPTQATPAIANGKIYFRTLKSLICVGGQEG